MCIMHAQRQQTKVTPLDLFALNHPPIETKFLLVYTAALLICYALPIFS